MPLDRTVAAVRASGELLNGGVGSDLHPALQPRQRPLSAPPAAVRKNLIYHGRFMQKDGSARFIFPHNHVDMANELKSLPLQLPG